MIANKKTAHLGITEENNYNSNTGSWKTMA